MLPLLVQSAAQVAKVEVAARPPRLPAKAKALAMLAGGADADWSTLRAELGRAVSASEKRPGRLHPATLTLRALAGLVLDRQGEERGLRLFAEACGALHRQLRLTQQSHGAEAKEMLPFLEALQELYQLEKLHGDRWEGLALRADVRHSKGPRPDLEQRVVAAVERHYGPFLSFRAADHSAVLADVVMLLELWARRERPTREFVEVGLRSDAKGVWKLVAAHADEPLRQAMKALLASLDPDFLLEDLRNFLPWLPMQEATPWKNEARSLAERTDAALQKAKAPAAAVLQRRVRLARAMGEEPRAIQMVSAALGESREDYAAILALAEELARDTADPSLVRLLHETLMMDLPRVAEEPSGRSLLVADAHRLEAQGDYSAAEYLWRCLLERPRALATEPGPAGPEGLERALGSNLAAQCRWEEARALLEPLTSLDKWQADPDLRFLLASLESSLGDAESARRWARAGVSLLAGNGPVKPIPGLAAALRILLQGDPGEGCAQETLERVRLGLDPESRIPALLEPTLLLTLLEGLERPNARPQATSQAACRGPWSALGGSPASQGLALLQAAEGVRLEDAEPCLREAIRHLERAWGEQDPRLLKPLLRLGQCLQDQSNPEAEGVFRRILALGAAHPDRDPLLDIETRARLGQLLGEAGREEEADSLLREALHQLAQAPSLDATGREMLGGVLVMLVARLEYREDYQGILEVLEQVEGLAEKSTGSSPDGFGMETELRKLVQEKARFTRQARLQALLRAQGLP